MLFSIIVHSIPPIPTVLATEKSVVITYDGKQVDEITIEQNEKNTLLALTNGMETPSFQWQILLDHENSVWVNIYDKTERGCEVSYALVKNMLDDAESTYIRCAATSAGKTVYSNKVCITVNSKQQINQNVTSFAQMRYADAYSIKDTSAVFSNASNINSDYVTITVKYLDAASLNGTEDAPIYSPYTATIVRGTDFKQSIVSPAFLGFAPYLDSNNDKKLDETDESAAILNLDYSSVTEDIEIKVYYRPIEVNFAIKYFFQNINDDRYTEDASRYYTDKAETGTLVTNEFLENKAGNTTGFTKMYHIPESVAADGSTVFECYYDRNYYLIQFDLDGGYGVDPIYARYGTPFLVNQPIKSGYTFAGWDLLTEDTNNDGELDTGDNIEDSLPAAIGASNMHFKAIWKSSKTTYNRAYWSENSDGTLKYLGAIRVQNVDTGSRVSGSDDLKDNYMSIFPFESHQHTVENGCYGCVYANHTHTLACYTSNNLTEADSLTGNQKTALDALKNAVSAPVESNIYRYRYQYSYYYNFFYFRSTWYYLGEGSEYGGLSYDTIDNPNWQNPYTTASANPLCDAGKHTHDNTCITCRKLEHTHNENCNPNPRYYVFDRADQNITIEGDGSSTVNIYYKPKQYTLRFFYARERTVDGKLEYQVLGGSTYGFGGGSNSRNNENTTIDELLNNTEGQWGNAEKPLDDDPFYRRTDLSGSTSDMDYITGKYKPEDEKYNSGGWTYLYFTFNARYGDNISTKWPIGVLAPVKMNEKHEHSYKYTDENGNEIPVTISKDNDYEYAYFSAWNGEFKVKYTQNNLWFDNKNKNETIKGRYMVLDENLLYDAQFNDSDTVNYLGFWDNGANVNWSVPKLFQYHLMLEIPKSISIKDGKVYENAVEINNAVVYDSDKAAADAISSNNGETHERVFIIKGDKTYEQFQSFRTFDDSLLAKQTATEIDGYTRDPSKRTGYRRANGYKSVMNEVLRDAYDIFFYYDLNRYSLTYFNYENVITSEYVDYDVPLTADQYNKKFDKYPPLLEPGAYEFAGWYTSPMRVVPINFQTARMPAENVVWYAKWVLVKHEVNFFTSYSDMLSYQDDPASVTPHASFKDVEHGTLVGNVDTPVNSGDGDMNLVFAGWFYIENGEKKAFTPLNMFVNKDMNIFAEWSSQSPQPYRISYVLQSNPDIHVSDDVTGYAYGGSTRTFNAKAGNPYNQLYNEYNNGYFPTINSHSVNIQTESDKENLQHNIYTFYYVEANNIEYTVRYVNKQTNIVMDTEKRTTNSAVITERFKAYSDMVPDAFYKRLVLEVVWDAEQNKYVGTDNNVITFYYMPNDTSTYYAVHFMLEKLGATAEEKENYDINGNGGYEETGMHIEGVGEIGSTVYISPQSISGFNLINNKSSVPIIYTDGTTSVAEYSEDKGGYGITVKESGTELYFFYERKEYTYKVNYYKYNSTESLSDSLSGTEYFGKDVTAEAKKIDGYTCVSNHTQTITICDDSDSPEINVITFFYAPIQYVAEYVPITSDGGILSNTIEVVSGTENLSGSVPTANQYYEFVGWYLDEACTQSALDYGTVDEATNRFTPDKTKMSETERNVFYAKFINKVGNLTIDRRDSKESDQVFVYEIRNNDTDEIIYVTVTGNGSKTIYDLPMGEYTVTQQNDWSWRYNDGITDVTHQNDNGTTVPFYTPEQIDKWLNGNSELVKNQRR